MCKSCSHDGKIIHAQVRLHNILKLTITYFQDPWWNFAIEAQAIDRVHRLGQFKDVTVTRFVMKDSVEERILEIQNRKHVLVNELYQSRDEAKHRKFEDLQLLFSKGSNIKR